MNVRAASSDDLQRIAEIHVSASLAAYQDLFPKEHFLSFTVDSRMEAFRQLLEGGEVSIDVAGDRRILGFCVHGPGRDPDAESENVYEIQSIYLEPRSWRHGVGSALMRKAETVARLSNYSAITLWVLDKNERAKRFYQHHGYEPDGGTKKSNVSEETILEIRLAKGNLA